MHCAAVGRGNPDTGISHTDGLLPLGICLGRNDGQDPGEPLLLDCHSGSCDLAIKARGLVDNSLGRGRGRGFSSIVAQHI